MNQRTTLIAGNLKQVSAVINCLAAYLGDKSITDRRCRQFLVQIRSSLGQDQTTDLTPISHKRYGIQQNQQRSQLG